MSESGISIESIALYLMYALIVACVLGIMVFSVIGIARNPRGSMMSLIGVGVFILILGIGWAMASGDVPLKFSEDYSPALWRWIDATLIAMYVLLIGGFILLIAMEILTAFK